MSKRLFTQGLVVAASVSMLAACAPTETPTTPGTPSANPTTSPTAAPTPTATPTGPAASADPTPAPSASATATATPEPSPSATASADPSASPSATPTPSATATATATSDISVVERTTFNGDIEDDFNAPLDNVTVAAKSLNATVPFEATVDTAGGTYVFNDAPAGVQIEIVATRPGYTTRKRVVVLKSNKQGDPDANKYDFTNDIFEMSDKPEVVTIVPARNAAGVDPATSFVLTFSEPMDRNTVEDNFIVRAYTKETLSVDGNSATETVNGQASLADLTGTKIWDESDFNITWNSDDSEATFTFKDEKRLPSDKDFDRVPDYQVTLNNGDGQIKDKSGITRTATANNGAFKLVINGNFEKSSKFSLQADTKKPEVSSIVAQTEENSGTNGDAINVNYSEPMIYYTKGVTIAGGMDGANSTEAPGALDQVTAMAAGKNYKLTVTRGGNIVAGFDKAPWSSFGGSAVYDTNDATHKRVILLPGNTSSARLVTLTPALTAGDTITGTVWYTDNTTESVSVSPTAAVYNGANGLDVALETLTNGATFTVTAVSGNANDNIETGETFTVTLAAGAKNAANTKTIRFLQLNGGGYGEDLGITGAAPFNIYPGVAAGNRANLYLPGDTIKIEVDTTVLDPAGNSVDSSNDDATASAT